MAYHRKRKDKKKKRRPPVFGDLGRKTIKAFRLAEKIERAFLRQKEAAARPPKPSKPKRPKKDSLGWTPQYRGLRSTWP